MLEFVEVQVWSAEFSVYCPKLYTLFAVFSQVPGSQEASVLYPWGRLTK